MVGSSVTPLVQAAPVPVLGMSHDTSLLVGGALAGGAAVAADRHLVKPQIMKFASPARYKNYNDGRYTGSLDKALKTSDRATLRGSFKEGGLSGVLNTIKGWKAANVAEVAGDV